MRFFSVEGKFPAVLRDDGKAFLWDFDWYEITATVLRADPGPPELTEEEFDMRALVSGADLSTLPPIPLCPYPSTWNDAYEWLVTFSQRKICEPTDPPVPLIVNAWAFTDDEDKFNRWNDTVIWANRNGCPEIVDSISDAEFYYVDRFSTLIGYGPEYGDQDHRTKSRPSPEELFKLIGILKTEWPSIVEDELSAITEPLKFKGSKARRLLVRANASASPPWGDWWSLSRDINKRLEFTKFRKAVNKVLAPHEVDHIDFKPSDDSLC